MALRATCFRNSRRFPSSPASVRRSGAGSLVRRRAELACAKRTGGLPEIRRDSSRIYSDSALASLMTDIGRAGEKGAPGRVVLPRDDGGGWLTFGLLFVR